MNRFLKKQGEYLLNYEWYAISLSFLFLLIPFTSSLSLSIIALRTLRKGAKAGILTLLASLLLVLFFALKDSVMPYAVSAPILMFITVYAGALLLRWTASWNIVVHVACLTLIILSVLLEAFYPSYVIKQFMVLVQLFRDVDPNGAIVHIFQGSQEKANQTFAVYFLGIKLFSVFFSAMLSLLFARYVQSLLFCPGGFQTELVSFGANRLMVLAFLIICYGVYLRNTFAIIMLPILMSYLAAAGMVLMYLFLSDKKNWLIVLVMCVPIIIVPYVMVPIYVILGAFDSIFHLKNRLLLQNSQNRLRGE